MYEDFWEGKMTKNMVAEEFSDSVVPVILSNSPRAHLLAAELQRKYRLSSVLCGSRRNILDLLSLDHSYLPLCPCRDRLALEQLIDFSDKWNECILVLIPVSDADRLFISENRDALESRYLIPKDGNIASLPMISSERWV